MIMEGQFTNQIYTFIKDQEYVEAIKILIIQLESIQGLVQPFHS